MEKLFVYGTLGPNCPNDTVLTVIGGTWESATITGTLKAEGWGTEMGYPGIIINDEGEKISGFIFSSENFTEHWKRLDDFEGDGYCRILAKVQVKGKGIIDAYVYALK